MLLKNLGRIEMGNVECPTEARSFREFGLPVLKKWRQIEMRRKETIQG
jgi:hypothetical protein